MNLADADREKLSPMMREYVQTKEQYKDCVLFYRLGDFYEMFFDDAIEVSRELDLQLTGRDCGLEERAPMCGVPHHSAELYIKRLVEKGYRIAICEQMTDPALAKGLVERSVVRVVTPGTLIENDMLGGAANNYLGCVYRGEEGTALCFADVSTGEAAVYRADKKNVEDDIINLLCRYAPSELIFNASFLDLKAVGNFLKIRLPCTCTLRDDEDFDPAKQGAAVTRQFSVTSLEELGLKETGAETRAVCALFAYIDRTQCQAAGRFTHLELDERDGYMLLDGNALRDLELTRTLRSNDRKGSLLWVLDETVTAMGKRMLKSWIERPLKSPARISARLDAVEELKNQTMDAIAIGECLEGMSDIERLMTRIVYKQATPRDLRALGEAAGALPPLKATLTHMSSPLLQRLGRRVADLRDMADLIERAIVEDPPGTARDGGVIREGFDPDLDSLREVMTGGHDLIEAIGTREREKTGIKNLKIGNNRVFGYYLEVSRSYLEKVPEYFERKQTLANAERFVTKELKDAENTVLSAKDRALQMEQELFAQVRDYIAQMLVPVQETAEAVAQVDVLRSFAKTAAAYNYCKPDIAVDGCLEIKDGRHPVVERMLEENVFVPNDVYLDTKETRLAIITGPNMSGKSTYMRQTALMVLMAHMGSFVPAARAKIPVTDRIFTRVGASDDLAAGESTFMVEMREVAEILRHATKESLVILDEVGRGTSTFDGISIARATAEYICSGRGLGCRTMFATHYHELTELAGEMKGVKNLSVAVRKGKDGIRFLRKILPGAADDSYGIDVARLAGLPAPVLKRAEEILAQLEQKAHEAPPAEEAQESFGAAREREIPEMLRRTSLSELSDSECRELLEEMSAKLDA